MKPIYLGNKTEAYKFTGFAKHHLFTLKKIMALLEMPSLTKTFNLDKVFIRIMSTNIPGMIAQDKIFITGKGAVRLASDLFLFADESGTPVDVIDINVNDFTVPAILPVMSYPKASLFATDTTIDCTNKIIYKYDTTGNVFRLFNLETRAVTLLSPAAGPTVRFLYKIVIDTSNQNIYLFGGRETGLLHGQPLLGGPDLNDLWKYDIALNTWTDITPVTSPPVRGLYAMVIDSANQRIYMGFGFELSGLIFYNDLWRYNIVAGTWANITPASKPSRRQGTQMVKRAGNIYTFGGAISSVSTENDLWRYNISAGLWTELSPATVPEARRGHAMAQADNRIFLLGGGPSVTDIDLFWVYAIAENTWTSNVLDTAIPNSWVNGSHTMEICDA